MITFLAHHVALMAAAVPVAVIAATVAGMATGSAVVRRTGRDTAAFALGAVVILTGVAAALGTAAATLAERDRIVTDAVFAKYGDQIDQVGALRDSRTRPRASTWVISGRETLCSISTRDLDDPFVSCGTELPLPPD